MRCACRLRECFVCGFYGLPRLLPIHACAQLTPAVVELLGAAEAAARAAKEARRHALWDEKMRGTQTQNACGVRVT